MRGLVYNRHNPDCDKASFQGCAMGRIGLSDNSCFFCFGFILGQQMRIQKLKQVGLDLISFDSPQARLFNLSAILAALSAVPTDKLGYFPIRCVFKHVIFPLIFGGKCPESGIFAGCNCPGCGMTRAMSRLLHLDPTGAYAYNKMVFVLFAVMVALIIINTIRTVQFRRKTGRWYKL
ncbi:DUF2752 domain-containing protein [Candidatus Woesearchaeota archaeon]|nr:DUF2752 domain-containing protein [Candidatus Woesearchaeota archaeon]